MTFKACANRGYHMVFPNGCTVSVQWGTGNYCDRNMESGEPMRVTDGYWESGTAEVAAWGPGNLEERKYLRWGGERGAEVRGYLTTTEVLKIINHVAEHGVEPMVVGNETERDNQ